MSAQRRAGPATEPLVDRRFEGARRLQVLLANSGSLADVEDVVAAFEQACAEGAPASAVIEALWEDEPRFASPADAAALFGNLLGLFELVARGEHVQVPPAERAHGAAPQRPSERAHRRTMRPGRGPPRPPPQPFGPAGPDDAFIQEALHHLDESPRVRQRLRHLFEQRHDALLCAVELAGLTDAACGIIQGVAFEAFALLELGARSVPASTPREWNLSAEAVAEGAGSTAELPLALQRWLEGAVAAAAAGGPSGEDTGGSGELARVRALVARVVRKLWERSRGAGPDR